MFAVKREPKTHWNIMTQYSLYKIKTDLTTFKFHKSSKKKVKAINTHLEKKYELQKGPSRGSLSGEVAYFK